MLQTRRPAYVWGLLIASRGLQLGTTCPSTPRGNPFGPFAIRIPGFWQGCCANCFWRERFHLCRSRIPDAPRYEAPPDTRVYVESQVDEMTNSSGGTNGAANGALNGVANAAANTAANGVANGVANAAINGIINGAAKAAANAMDNGAAGSSNDAATLPQGAAAFQTEDSG
ncbi:unnamed protein product [Penicillium salamii]|uniref:Uncharacterized protein n=1 Tax=Penicillium salamii TaxID=1612424 RepID=A0A9W4JBP6_9EURO|nr:unnamed protein product [Penicillium salamii]CAG8236353.1 unnamed protein product [Penicillium salamii]CAG8345210.1 unnamed protein product [Penicillium salamii]CAG8383836.1 unnamed protein product [Penicillium salamii]CAG8387940.1 unnamed protein product [Penicillium salamii]